MKSPTEADIIRSDHSRCQSSATRHALVILCAVFTLICLPQTLLARSTDYNQAIDVTADRSEYDEKAGLQRLIGNVRITQGSIRIVADSITVRLQNNKLSVIEGQGSPIEFTQENDEGELISGQCSHIVYDATNGQLTLQGEARLTEPGQSLRSDKIVFDSKTQTVVAEGGDSGQVSITLQPPEQSD